MIIGEYAVIIYNRQALMKQTTINVSFKDLYMLIAFYCLCSDVHGGSSRYDGTQRSGRGDGVLLQRGRDTLILPGDTVVVHQEPRGLDGQTALDNQ